MFIGTWIIAATLVLHRLLEGSFTAGIEKYDGPYGIALAVGGLIFFQSLLFGKRAG